MLPITKILPQVLDCLSHSNNLVLQAEPGAGKSTALPLSLLDAKWLGNKKIVMLEPRRVAAKSIAYYLAKQLGEKAGLRTCVFTAESAEKNAYCKPSWLAVRVKLNQRSKRHPGLDPGSSKRTFAVQNANCT